MKFWQKCISIFCITICVISLQACSNKTGSSDIDQKVIIDNITDTNIAASILYDNVKLGNPTTYLWENNKITSSEEKYKLTVSARVKCHGTAQVA
ncbi:hypothetical protein [Acetivibrio cellulolyticus]|uniref:hypothetical protein n=1 Tax=Acetivibrio cellulolyticus TaxID=35830 RepID=UPI0001E2C26B|nr:hypothetical protein [Acetivibrio cellulolyticus]